MDTKDHNAGEAGLALERIARKLKLDIDTIREVYHEKDGEIVITVPATKIPGTKKAGTKALALLLTAARQGAELEEFTTQDAIRKVAEDYRRYDAPNFARTIGEMKDIFRFMGKGRERSVGLSRPGWETAAGLVKSLAGGEV